MTITHYYCEVNRAADVLANIGVGDLRSLVILSTPVDSLSSILLEDLLGVAWPRLI